MELLAMITSRTAKTAAAMGLITGIIALLVLLGHLGAWSGLTAYRLGI